MLNPLDEIYLDDQEWREEFSPGLTIEDAINRDITHQATRLAARVFAGVR